jgi:hypothetical protein
MNLQTLIVVILRLMSLNFLLQVAIGSAPRILHFIEIYQHAPSDDLRSLLVLPWLVVVGLIISAILLWVFALPIARLVTRGVPHDLSFGALSLVDCYSIAFVSVGLFYIASHLAQVLNWTHYLFKAAASKPGNTWKEGFSWYEVSQAFIPFIVGVVLFVNGRRWAVTLAHRQTESSIPSTTVSEKHEPDA